LGKLADRRALFALAVILIGANAATVYYFTIFKPRIPLSEIPISVDELIHNFEDYKGKRVFVTGYILKGPYGPVLVGHPFNLLNNTMEFNTTILFTGEAIPDLPPAGRCSDVECDVDPECDPRYGLLKVNYISHIIREDLRVLGVFEDMVRDSSILEGLDLNFSLQLSQKYAVLYSGGWREDKAYFRYWNDLSFMYSILRTYGYPADNIYVVYKDGVGEDTNTPVDYPATQTAMETIFQELNETLSADDKFFFFTTNHGGASGLTTYWPNGGDQYLNTTEVAGWLDSITCDHMIIVMEQCWSGQFISAISAPNRVILTACDDGESSYACDTEGQWDEYVYHFMSALIGTKLPGGVGDAWADFIVEDGKISMREAHLYAVLHDSWPENPMYDDDGDGVGLWGGPVFFGSGFYGDNIFL